MQDSPHVRRVHYSGKYPKNFSEKYKELASGSASDEIAAHVAGKGSTPAGQHIPIMVTEILECLHVTPGETGLDATLGYGGHTRNLLRALNGSGHLYATDVDPVECAKTESRLRAEGFDEDVLTVRNMNFAGLDKLAAEAGAFNFVLADLGISSMQLDNPERGFSYKTNGPLDLRMNQQKGLPAQKLLQQLPERRLRFLLEENADEPYAEEIARRIKNFLSSGREIRTTIQLRQIIENCFHGMRGLPAEQRTDAAKKSCARVFQALRIAVNQEFKALDTFLAKLPYVLAPGARVAILTFHSGEDRRVKLAFKEYKRMGILTDTARTVIRPTVDECFANPRARSAKLRWAIK